MITTKSQIENNNYVESLKFKKFNISEEMKDRKNFACSIVAKRNSGKSVLLKDLCSQIKGWYHETFVFSLSAHLQPDLFNFVKPENIITEFNEDKLLHLWSAQEKLVAKLKMIKTDPEKIPKILVLFDDVIGDKRVRNSEVLNNFFILGRHLHFAVMIITQEMGGRGGIPKVVRANLDLAIAFFLNSENDRKLFTEQYLSTKNKKIGSIIYDKIAHQPYQSIVILNYKTAKNPEDYIRTYMAKENVPKFMMGNTQQIFDSIIITDRPHNGNIFT